MKRHLRWILPFGLAFFLRLALLGAQPLDDREAALAWQAWEIAQGGRPLLRPELAYLFPTAGLFWLQLSGDWAARLWPALAGLSLVFIPWVLRRELGERLAFWLALGLAIDPFLTAASRRAEGSILAVAALAWALTAVRKGRLGWAGAAFMLALMSGPGIWFLVAGLLLTALLLTSLTYEQVRMTWDMARWLWGASGQRLQRLLLGAGAVWLLAALVRLPSLAAWLRSLPVWLAGWNDGLGTPPGFFTLGWVLYGSLPLGLAVLSRANDRLHGRRDFFAAAAMALGALTAFVVIFYPAHQPTDLVWSVLPLWWLGAGLLAQAETWLLAFAPPAVSAAAVTLTMFSFLWLQMEAILVRFGSFSQPVSLFFWTVNLSERSAQLLVWLVGWLILLVALSLIANLWGRQAAWQGFWQGAALSAFLFAFSLSWGATGLRAPNGFEFWQAEGKIVGARVLRSTVDDFIARNGGNASALDVQVLDLPSPSLRWALRGLNVQSVAVVDVGQSPAFVIAPPQTAFPSQENYRGQPLTWLKRPAWWLGGDPISWGRWVMLRMAPSSDRDVTLWVREDLFPDGVQSP